MNGNTKKVAGAATIVSLAIGVLVLWDKGGAFVEPAVTQKITAKVETMARRHDADQEKIMGRLDKFKSDLSNEMKENNREQIRLIIEALRREGRTP